MRTVRIMAVSLPLAVMFGCGGGDQPAADGGEPVTVFLEAVDSMGVAVGDSAYLFGSIQSATFADNGELVLLDRAFSHVSVYSSDGGFLRSMGRQGSGPGEMSLSVLMAVTGSGDVFVCQRDATDRFRLDTGEWIEEYPRGLTPPPFLLAGMPDSSCVAVAFDFEPRGARLTGITILGIFLPGETEPSVILMEDEFDLDPLNSAFLFEKVIDGYQATVSPEGTVYAARSSGTEYEVVAYSPTGERLLEISADAEPVEKTPEEMEEEAAFLSAVLTSMGAPGESCSPEPLWPQISGLGLDARGNIWVRRGTEPLPTFDVFSGTGEPLFIATMPMAGMEGRYWKIVVRPQGILAWSENPMEGFQKLYFMHLD